MQEIIEALAAHKEWESQPVEVRLPGGSWVDMEDMLAPYIKAWEQIGTLANTDALDEEGIRNGNLFLDGRSSMAHSVLRIMAAAEHEAANR